MSAGMPPYYPTYMPRETATNYRAARQAYFAKLEQQHLDEVAYRERVSRRWFALGYVTFATAVGLVFWTIWEAVS